LNLRPLGYERSRQDGSKAIEALLKARSWILAQRDLAGHNGIGTTDRFTLIYAGDRREGIRRPRL
jgi:hypothetical protein